MRRVCSICRFGIMVVVCLGCFVSHAESLQELEEVSIEDVTERFLEQIKNDETVVKATRVANGDVEIEFANGWLSRVTMVNLHAEMNQEPAQAEETLTQFVSTVSAALVEQAPISQGELLPIVRPKSYLQQLRDSGANIVVNGLDHVPAVPHRTLAGDYLIFVVQDRPASSSVVTQDELKNLRMNEEELFEKASKNFINRFSQNLYAQIIDDIRMVLLDGYYESSVLLFDGYWRAEPENGLGDIIAIPLARDVLLYCSAADKATVARMIDLARSQSAQLTGMIGIEPIRWSGTGWEPFDD